MTEMGPAVSLGEPWGLCRRKWKERPALPDTLLPFCIRKGVTKNPPKRSVQDTPPPHDYLTWKTGTGWAQNQQGMWQRDKVP